ncbi:MAG: LPS-assembly protein LptD [Candidatus Obscuribacter sp.]|nr:LPS-assembly protein LptD [Candidatus Obscuribacter sp.]
MTIEKLFSPATNKITFVSAPRRRCLALASTLVLLGNFASGSLIGAFAATAKKDSAPSTLLLPLTPRIDDSNLKEEESTPANAPPGTSKTTPAKVESEEPQVIFSSSEIKTQEPKLDDAETSELKVHPNKISAEAGDASTRLELEASEDDLRMAESDAQINEDTTLKGTIQIVADDTEYDQERNTFLGTGNAVAVIGGQNSKLEADAILYDQNTQMIDARGNVKIVRDGNLTTGSSFKFNVTSDEYLITKPDTEVKGTEIIARSAYGKGTQGLTFKNGTMTMPKAFHIGRNVAFGPLTQQQELMDRTAHPEVFLPEKPSFTFKARKMVYERYKESGNLTVFGGKLAFGRFNVPLPKFVATVGTESRVTFPITPMITNNLQSGGINIGPNFNTPMGKTGVLSWAPMIQLGGRGTNGNSNSGSTGLSGQVAFNNARISSHIAYGSVSNLFIADFKAKLSDKTMFQAGVNRFMQGGLDGYRRPHLIAEVVDNRYVRIPKYLSGIGFRTAAGAMQDNPQLINLNPEYAKLFGGPTTSKSQPSAFRLSEQITTTTQPLFSVGNEKVGARGYIFGGLGLNAYSSGNYRALLQAGPTIETRLKRARFQFGYVQSAVRGSSPFVFDQFIQGQRSAYISGDIKVHKYLTLGGSYGYNLNSRLAYNKSFTAAIGPDDFKLLLTRNTITGQNRMGFDVLYGAPVPFQKLVLKGSGDHGNLTGL